MEKTFNIAGPCVPLGKFVKEADGIILGVPHSAYKGLRLKKPFVDCWGCWLRG